ncbi:MFS efflux transporter [Colletotrichum karsti]|uniref:MFS efflux transporter n=1 Tax=Colletotrichum karsti TaxID=1095194 RepID=A0A9P6LK84_9PEZI|nr:MFS efflux transporter [Colletotrichum karsti]KAF9875357.1 MFS efflux transporter [Colletotrichum karsti]
MNTSTFDAFITHEQSQIHITPPAKAASAGGGGGAPLLHVDSNRTTRAPESIHLHHLSKHPSSIRNEPPATALESNRPSGGFSRDDAAAESAEPTQSVLTPYMNRWRFLAACLMNMGNGINDGAPGALIPYMEKYYDIGYAVVSLIFIGNALGFITAAFFVDALRARLSRAHLMIAAQACLLAAYIPLVAGAPFPVIVLSFFLLGFGMATNLTLNTLFCGSLRNGTTALGALHGAYGLGGTIGPILATAMVSSIGWGLWFRFYLIPMALAAFSLVFSAWSFARYENDNPAAAENDPADERRPTAKARLVSMFHALRRRLVFLGALFVFAYQGAEVSISGWVISFLVDSRQVANPEAVGYVTAGFWAGITVGRFLLSGLGQRVGEKLFVYVMTAGAACFQLLVWFVPNIVGNAVSLAIVGLLLGPIYPCAATVFLRGMSSKSRTSGIAIITAFGSSGGALAPFTTGMIAQASGTWVLHPIALALFAAMIGCWVFLSSRSKRED